MRKTGSAFSFADIFWPYGLLVLHRDSVFPDRGTVHLNGGAVWKCKGPIGKFRGAIFLRKAAIFSNGASIFLCFVTKFWVFEVLEVQATFLTPKLSVGLHTCYTYNGSRV